MNYSKKECYKLSRTNKNNKFSSIANSNTYVSVRDSLTEQDRLDYDNLNSDLKLKYEKFCKNQINGEKSVQFFLKINSEMQNLNSNQKPNTIDDIKNEILERANVYEAAGKNISVYLSSNTLNLLTVYMKENKIKNRSKLIEEILLAKVA